MKGASIPSMALGCAESHAISLFTNDKICEAMLYFAHPCGADVANHNLDGMLLCSVWAKQLNLWGCIGRQRLAKSSSILTFQSSKHFVFYYCRRLRNTIYCEQKNDSWLLVSTTWSAIFIMWSIEKNINEHHQIFINVH